MSDDQPIASLPPPPPSAREREEPVTNADRSFEEILEDRILSDDKLSDEGHLIYDFIGDIVTGLITSTISIPPSIPVLEKVDLVPTGTRKIARFLGKRFERVDLDEIIMLMEKTNEFWGIHFDLVESGRVAYKKEVASYMPSEDENKGFWHRFRLRRKKEVVIIRPEDKIRDRYFEGLTQRLSQEEMHDYIDLSVVAIKVARSRVAQKIIEGVLDRALTKARQENPEFVSGYVAGSYVLDRAFDYMNTHGDSIDTVLQSYRTSGDLFVKGLYLKWGSPKMDENTMDGISADVRVSEDITDIVKREDETK